MPSSVSKKVPIVIKAGSRTVSSGLDSFRRWRSIFKSLIRLWLLLRLSTFLIFIWSESVSSIMILNLDSSPLIQILMSPIRKLCLIKITESGLNTSRTYPQCTRSSKSLDWAHMVRGHSGHSSSCVKQHLVIFFEIFIWSLLLVLLCPSESHIGERCGWHEHRGSRLSLLQLCLSRLRVRHFVSQLINHLLLSSQIFIELLSTIAQAFTFLNHVRVLIGDSFNHLLLLLR